MDMPRYRHKTETNDLFSKTTARAREGIPLQPIPKERATIRLGQAVEFNGTTNQNLVPEPAHETQERMQQEKNWRLTTAPATTTSTTTRSK